MEKYAVMQQWERELETKVVCIHNISMNEWCCRCWYHPRLDENGKCKECEQYEE